MPESVVIIGNNCNLSGGTIRCFNKIELGNKVLLAYSLIQDNIFVNSTEKPKPIAIGSNSWLSNNTIILGESYIGDNCVASVGSVCRDQIIPESRLIVGNPVIKSLPIGVA